MTSPSSRATRLYGCGTVLFTLGVMCVLLVANSMATAAVYKLMRDVGVKFIQENRAGQAFLLATPLLLMCFEWWVIDLIVDLQITRRERRAGAHLKSGDKTDDQTA